MISCREIMNLPSLTKLAIVAGKPGLDRLVRWVHFIDLPDVIPWVQGGELLIITGIGLNGDENKLKEIVQGIIKKKLAGLIINIGPYIKSVPAEVIALADQADFPIFELPWEVKLIEVTREICSHIVMKQTEQRSIKDFLEQLLLCPLENPEVLIQRAAYYGYDLAKPHQVAILSPDCLTAFLQTQKAKDEKALVALKVRLEQIVQEVLMTQGRKILQMLWADDIVLLVPYENESIGGHQNITILTEILEKISAKIPGLGVTVGLGGRFESLQAARQGYLQAMKVLRFAKLKKASRSIYAYEQLGIYKLLFEIEPEKLAMYHQDVIEPLNLYDNKHHMDMVSSLFVYFEENCNAVKTAKRLYVHRNTLDYRLKKIEEITGRSLDNPYDRLTLQLGVIVGRLLTSEIFPNTLRE
ncbi:PucR family transcriptional regulator [Pelosinus propionicus]|uniref:PucR C-terminal helix-turn-helix domain-containing protein n=1 Tax=Pelosinus propionicus DSM 13327 TaxID=1123291 RepID=A0A1I4LZU3_9FIRM|nr:PucR family transcriptional regulator [Pelosinus propionicus]SFL96521.1 PucR C-terminal helix-turn-helix domain-containing protein [Pelosinus propionicus DSM 13327]